MAPFGDWHNQTGAGWSVWWRISALQGGGLEVGSCDFQGRTVLHRGGAPFALVPYHRPPLGPEPPAPFFCYKDGFAAACGGVPFTALRHQAPNGQPVGWNASVDTDAVVVDVHPATDFDPEELTITAKFQCGWYQYVHRWTFDRDGGIHPAVAMGGRLNPNARATAHLHHFYFRLDFDIDGSGQDVVELFNHNSFNDPGGDHWQVVSSQGKFLAEPHTARKWRVRDLFSTNQFGLSRSYELELPQLAGRDQYSTGDVWVTVWRGNSVQQGEGISCTDTALDTQYAVGSLDTTNGNDVVLWAVIRAHHEPRNNGEEQVILPYHFHEMSISPRNFRP